PARVLRETHQHARVGELRAQLLEPRFDLAAKPAVEQQVLRRVSGKCEFGVENEVRAELAARTPRAGDDFSRITADVPDQEVELSQRDLQRVTHGRRHRRGIRSRNRGSILSRVSAACRASSGAPGERFDCLRTVVAGWIDWRGFWQRLRADGARLDPWCALRRAAHACRSVRWLCPPALLDAAAAHSWPSRALPGTSP